MQMTWRWYGEGNDSITPEMIKQIPGVTGLVWALHDKQPGEVWEVEEIEKVRQRIEGAGFNMDVVESVNVHDDIKIGLPTRDKYIENYKTTLRNLAKFGVKVVTYNFMPILRLDQDRSVPSLRGRLYRPVFMKKAASRTITGRWRIIS